MHNHSRVALVACALVSAVAHAASAQAPKPTTPSAATSGPKTVASPPLKYDAKPTTPAITPGDLMSRLYVFADDSMQGREAGRVGNLKGTEYLAAEAKRIGLEPAGENGTYFQTIPMIRHGVEPKSTIVAAGSALKVGPDYLMLPRMGELLPFGSGLTTNGTPVVFGGRIGNPAAMISPAAAEGKIVVFLPPMGPDGKPAYQFWGLGGLDRYLKAKALVFAALDITPEPYREAFGDSYALKGAGDSLAPTGLAGLLVSNRVASLMLGGTPGSMRVGALGAPVTANIMYGDLATDAPARNVVAILRGSDPKLRAEFVAIGAHNDHNGLMAQAVDHDSLEAYDRVLRPQGAESEDRPATADEMVRVAAIRDSLTKAHGGARRDSVMNGADDDGSGSVTVLEIAEALAKGAERPKRSILFVWHTAEEKGLFGSQYFTDHPTVPRDSIVAQLNMDMVGRGSASDLPNGSPNYLQLLGSRRLSTELGDLVEKVNTTKGYSFAFDYSFDADGHPQQYYCRSDHYMYARYGIPITFFSTGAHHDYHQATDEPQYIDYEHMARVGNYVKDLALTVANLDHRPVVDKPKPDPKKDCKQ